MPPSWLASHLIAADGSAHGLDEVQRLFAQLFALGAILGIVVFAFCFVLGGVAIWLAATMAGVHRTFWAAVGAAFLGSLVAIVGSLLGSTWVAGWKEHDDLLSLAAWTLALCVSTWFCLRPGLIPSLVIALVAQVVMVVLLLGIAFALAALGHQGSFPER